jgi:hypothetical protein
VFRSSIITYDGLPVSKGGAHRLRTPNPKLALRQARDFLTVCTDNSIPKAAFVEVIRGRSFDDEFSLSLIEQLTRKLGDSSRRHAGTRNIAHRWDIKAHEIDEYVDMMSKALTRFFWSSTVCRGRSDRLPNSGSAEGCGPPWSRVGAIRQLFSLPRSGVGTVSTLRPHLGTIDFFVIS